MIKGGYEFNLALMAIAAGLLLAGPGPLSVHQTIDSVLAERRASLLGRRRRRRRSKLFRILAALLR
jgi:putative oxidoreductase